jgi:hypothetical protein
MSTFDPFVDTEATSPSIIASQDEAVEPETVSEAPETGAEPGLGAMQWEARSV